MVSAPERIELINITAAPPVFKEYKQDLRTAWQRALRFFLRRPVERKEPKNEVHIPVYILRRCSIDIPFAVNVAEILWQFEFILMAV